MNARHRQQRSQRRARANQRVIAPVAADVRDPLSRRSRPAGAGLGRGAVLMIVAAGLHVAVLFGFIAANWISEKLREQEEAPKPPAEVAVIEAEPENENARPPPEEPELDPLPAPDAYQPSYAQPQAPAPQIGISADSTVEGGDGPAFQTGDSLAGAMSSNDLSQEILRKEPQQRVGPEELVMTDDTVDAQPRPLSSNQPPSMPAKARAKGIGGFVVVRMIIGKDGAVHDVKVIQASPPGMFEDNVLEVVRSWRFTPAVYNGQPQATQRDQTIRFEIS